MGFVSFLRGVMRAEDPTTYVEGTIVDAPTRIDADGAADRVFTFRLDTCPELQFRHALSAIASERRRGERVRVHYRMAGKVADVHWVEKI